MINELSHDQRQRLMRQVYDECSMCSGASEKIYILAALDIAYEAGYRKGDDDGFERGYDEGYDDGVREREE